MNAERRPPVDDRRPAGCRVDVTSPDPDALEHTARPDTRATSARDAYARRRDAAARLEPMPDGRRDPLERTPAPLFPTAAQMETRYRAWLDDPAPILEWSPGTPACDGSCSALGIDELRTLAVHGCTRCGQPPVAPDRGTAP